MYWHVLTNFGLWTPLILEIFALIFALISHHKPSKSWRKLREAPTGLMLGEPCEEWDLQPPDRSGTMLHPWCWPREGLRSAALTEPAVNIWALQSWGWVICFKALRMSFDRRKFRSQTSDNMDRWKAEMERVREKRRVEERRAEKRRCRCAKR